MNFGKGLLLVDRKDFQRIQLTLSLVAGPGPAAGVKISFFPPPSSTKVSPSRLSEVRPSRMAEASFSSSWSSGGGIILVDMTGPDGEWGNKTPGKYLNRISEPIEINDINKYNLLVVSHSYLRLFAKFVLKQSSDLELTIAEGKEFHSHMDLRKKRTWKSHCAFWVFYI